MFPGARAGFTADEWRRDKIHFLLSVCVCSGENTQFSVCVCVCDSCHEDVLFDPRLSLLGPSVSDLPTVDPGRLENC